MKIRYLNLSSIFNDHFLELIQQQNTAGLSREIMICIPFHLISLHFKLSIKYNVRRLNITICTLILFLQPFIGQPNSKLAFAEEYEKFVKFYQKVLGKIR
jgi:hypothetical protein